jgi:hypothetical protein
MLHRRAQQPDPLAQGTGTSIISQVLMADVIVVVMLIGMRFRLIMKIGTPGCRALPRNSVSQQLRSRCSDSLIPQALSLLQATPSILSSISTPLDRSALSHRTLAMPRIRGTPRRGAAWYAAESRRKRKAAFEKAIAIATRRRRAKARSPPMAIVEEEIPEGDLSGPPEHTLFTVPENWNPRSAFGLFETQQVATGTSTQGNSSIERPYSPCYIEEEVPPEATKETAGDQQQGADMEQPPVVDASYINLIFDMRNLIEDQNFRMARLEQRLDMFYAAHSRATPKKQCPTCARPYAFPARWRHTAADDTHPGSEVF